MTSPDPSITLYAFRYALGRRSYAVFEVVEYLLEHWNSFHLEFKTMLCEEIQVAIKENKAGSSKDIRAWKRILHFRAAEKEEKDFNSNKNGSFW